MKSLLLVALIVSGFLSVIVQAEEPVGLLALTHATVIDATGADPRPDSTVVISGDRITSINQSPASAAAALLGAVALGVVNQNLVHGSGSDGKEVGASLPAWIGLIGQSQIGLVDQGPSFAGCDPDAARSCSDEPGVEGLHRRGA